MADHHTVLRSPRSARDICRAGQRSWVVDEAALESQRQQVL
eukprot:CAMPEP_0202870834 /NCGR_PEP_ID=MMETSP1391-20130828/16923_1 /ASSEMBLY_ACC=CAM_ASM_000867 /TAXON_ID=1034604 /ORGANISM="Chlamydomonas leiostraca, Strain SAG 11-49" /LENGTH=40 /DNA_ID= /DNA_START= /DNA_END= /DNA_ORIENTATION=